MLPSPLIFLSESNSPIDTFQLAIWLIVSSLRPPQQMRCIPYISLRCALSAQTWRPGSQKLWIFQPLHHSNRGFVWWTKQVCQTHPNLQLSAATPPFPLAHSSTNLTVLCTSAPPRGLRNWSDRSCNFIGDVTLQAFGNKGFVGSCRTNETRWFSSMLHFTCRCITKGISQNPFTLMFEEASTLKLNCLNPSCTCVGGLVNVLPAVAPTFSKDAPSSTAHVGVFILSLHVFRSQNHFFQVSQYLWICEPWLLWSGLNSAYYASELNQNLYFDLYPDCRVPIFLWTLDYSESEILFSAAMHRSCAALAVLSLPLASVAAWRQLRPTTSSRSGTSILFNNAKYILYST